jgi:hypothetical protein
MTTSSFSKRVPRESEVSFQRLILPSLVACTHPMAGVCLFGFLSFYVYFDPSELNRTDGGICHIPIVELLQDLFLCTAYLATRRLAVPISLCGLLNAQDIVLTRPSALPFTLSVSRVPQGDAVTTKK